MNETADPPAKKRPTRRYSVEVQKEALRQCSLGTPQPAIAAKLGIPQQTIAHWACKSGIRRQGPQSIANRVEASLTKAIEQVTVQATGQAAALLKRSHQFGNTVLSKAKRLLNTDDSSELLAAANAGKVGVAIARQALGLDDERQASANIRINNLVIQSRSPDNLIELETIPCGVSDTALTVTPTPVDTTSEISQ